MVNEMMNKQRAKAILQIYKNTTLMFLLTIEGLVVIAVENAINAAIKIVQKAGRHRHQVVVVQSGDVPPYGFDWKNFWQAEHTARFKQG